MPDQKNIKSAGKELQLVTFRLSGEDFGLDISMVKEIIRLQNITPMPKAPEFIEGVINLRGQIIAVMDLAKRLSVAKLNRTEKSRIVVVEIEGNTVGLIVDEVPEVLRLSEENIDPAPEMFESKVHTDYIGGVGKVGERLVIILNTSKVLSGEELKQVGEVAEKSK